jgi:arylsulfatase A-like enzyme
MAHCSSAPSAGLTVKLTARTLRLLLPLLLVGFASVRAGEAAQSPLQPAERPNFLFLFSDDQRADTIHAWGNRYIRTPNVDRLVARGFSFRGNYCFGSNSGAVCVPSRAMLMTGRTWFHVPADMSGAKLLSELLCERGYTTFATGKWHNGPASFLRGFQRGKAVFFGGMADHTKVPVQDLSRDHRLVNARTGEKFSSELFADAAIEFLNDYRDPAPFFAYVAFTAPHDPRMPPERYRQEYYDHRPPLPKNFLPLHPFDNGQLIGRDEFLAPWPRPREMISDQLCEYYGAITHLDEQVGRVLAALERSGRARNTIVVYAADHGLALGSHGLLGKQSVYEHSMRAPLVVAGPGVPAGRSTRAFTYLLDLYPTLARLAGVPAPTELEGHDLRPLWEGRAERVRDSVFLPYQNLMRAVRDRRWKMIVYPQINHRQLFDLRDDPDELKNRAEEPRMQKRIERLIALLRQWQARVGDTQPLTVEHPGPRTIDLSKVERKPDEWQPTWIRKKYFGLSD